MRATVIHLVDDESIIHDIFKRIFREPDYELIISENKSQAKANHYPDVDVVIMDQMIPGTSGIEIFRELKKDDPDIRVIFLTAYGTIESAIEAIRCGAIDYLEKPFDNAELKHKIERAVREKRLVRENTTLHKALNEAYSFPHIIGQSPLLRKALDIVESVADSTSTVLITGESGTGKELVAKATHLRSNRRDRPFYPFNSSNIPAPLFESLLFGYKKGAFTGATSDRKGIFEEADGGSIFFDEIANLTFETQAKVLRVIQEKEIQPLGGNRIIKTDVRIIAATNVDLLEKVRRGDFRDDLYYRLNIINIHLPPLRERKEDIPMLAAAFNRRFSEANARPVRALDEKFLKLLMEYNWPGNIRELENAVLRTVLLSQGDSLQPAHLPPEVLDSRRSPLPCGSFNDQVDAFKRQLIIETLDRHGWVQKRAAEELRLKPSTLTEQIKRLGIRK